MTRQGSCQNSTPDALAVVDRLAGLSKVISPAIIEQALLDTGRAEQRACRLFRFPMTRRTICFESTAKTGSVTASVTRKP
jgi:hypothetical protein